MSKKRRRKKKKSQAPLILVILAAVAAVCVALVWMNSGPSKTVVDQNKFFSISGTDGAAIILNDELLEECGRCIDGVVYLPYETVRDKIDSGFYLEGGVLIRTLQDGTYQWTAGDDSGFLIRDEEGNFFVSSDCLREYADVELAVYEEPHRVVIRSSWENVTTAEAAEDTQIRVYADERSDIAAEVAAGETLDLLEEGETWSRVASGDGHIGYLKTEYLSEARGTLTHEPDPRFSFAHLVYPETIKMVWHYIDRVENNAYLQGMLADTKNLNIICPTWFVLGDAQGNLISYADADYAQRVKTEYGLSLWAMIYDYTGSDSSTGRILSSAENRANIVSQLMEMALTYGLEGFNIDFETITAEQAPAFLQFLRELTTAAHERGIYVSVDNYVPMYTRYYDRAEQARIVDYIFVMGYDEHTGSSPEIGSVASLPFVEQGVTDTLAEVPASQIVLGVPFYTRGWTERFGVVGFESEWLDMVNIQGFVDGHGIQTEWDPTVGQYFGSADDAERRYSIWVEDARSMTEKLNLIGKYQLAGASAWRVGIETSDIWDVWEAILP